MFVPGGPGLPASFYRELLEGLSKQGAVVTYEMAGVWPNDNPFPTTVTKISDELREAVALVHSSHPGPTIVVGHSFGAAVALDALCDGLEVDQAVLISGFSSGHMVRNGIMERLNGLPAEFHERLAASTGDSGAVMELIQQFWFPNHFCRVEWPQSLLDGLGKMNAEYSSHFLGPNLFDLSGEAMKWSRESDLSNIAVPVLLIGGSHDYFRLEDLRALERQIPDSQLHLSEEASHSIWLEDPALFHQRVEQFLLT